METRLTRSTTDLRIKTEDGYTEIAGKRRQMSQTDERLLSHSRSSSRRRVQCFREYSCCSSKSRQAQESVLKKRKEIAQRYYKVSRKEKPVKAKKIPKPVHRPMLSEKLGLSTGSLKSNFRSQKISPYRIESPVKNEISKEKKHFADKLVKNSLTESGELYEYSPSGIVKTEEDVRRPVRLVSFENVQSVEDLGSKDATMVPENPIGEECFTKTKKISRKSKKNKLKRSLKVKFVKKLEKSNSGSLLENLQEKEEICDLSINKLNIDSLKDKSLISEESEAYKGKMNQESKLAISNIALKRKKESNVETNRQKTVSNQENNNFEPFNCNKELGVNANKPIFERENIKFELLNCNKSLEIHKRKSKQPLKKENSRFELLSHNKKLETKPKKPIFEKENTKFELIREKKAFLKDKNTSFTIENGENKCKYSPTKLSKNKVTFTSKPNSIDKTIQISIKQAKIPKEATEIPVYARKATESKAIQVSSQLFSKSLPSFTISRAESNENSPVKAEETIFKFDNSLQKPLTDSIILSNSTLFQVKEDNKLTKICSLNEFKQKVILAYRKAHKSIQSLNSVEIKSEAKKQLSIEKENNLEIPKLLKKQLKQVKTGSIYVKPKKKLILFTSTFSFELVCSLKYSRHTRAITEISNHSPIPLKPLPFKMKRKHSKIASELKKKQTDSVPSRRSRSSHSLIYPPNQINYVSHRFS